VLSTGYTVSPLINNRTVPVKQTGAEDLVQHVADEITLLIGKVNQHAVAAVANKESATEKPCEATKEVKV